MSTEVLLFVVLVQTVGPRFNSSPQWVRFEVSRGNRASGTDVAEAGVRDATFHGLTVVLLTRDSW